MLKLSTSLCIAAVSAIKTAQFEDVLAKQDAETGSRMMDGAWKIFSPVEELQLAEYGNSVPIATLRADPEMISQKMGLITRKDMTQGHYDSMTGYVSWTYNYSLYAEP
jgi:hypothetical protein